MISISRKNSPRGSLLASFGLPALLAVGATHGAESQYRVLGQLADASTPAAQVLRMDNDARRLYAGRDGGIDVYDLASGKRTGVVEVKGHVKGLALAPDLKMGYASVPDSNSVALFDLQSLRVVSTAKSAGTEPTDIEYDAATGRTYVSNAGSGELAALDARTGKVVAKVKLGGRPRQAVTDGRGHVYVADEARHVVQALDSASLRSLGAIPVWPGEAPMGITNDVRERRLYVSCANGMMIVLDPDSGQMISYVNTRGRGASGIAMQYAPARLVRLYIPAADGTLDIVKNAKLTATLETSVPAAALSTAVAVDQGAGKVFVAGSAGLLVIGQ